MPYSIYLELTSICIQGGHNQRRTFFFHKFLPSLNTYTLCITTYDKRALAVIELNELPCEYSKSSLDLTIKLPPWRAWIEPH